MSRSTCCSLAATVRFFHYALFWEVLLSLKNYVVDFVVVLAAAAAGYRLTRARQMAAQYGWIFGRAPPAIAANFQHRATARYRCKST